VKSQGLRQKEGGRNETGISKRITMGVLDGGRCNVSHGEPRSPREKPDWKGGEVHAFKKRGFLTFRRREKGVGCGKTHERGLEKQPGTERPRSFSNTPTNQSPKERGSRLSGNEIMSNLWTFREAKGRGEYQISGDRPKSIH